MLWDREDDDSRSFWEVSGFTLLRIIRNWLSSWSFSFSYCSTMSFMDMKKEHTIIAYVAKIHSNDPFHHE